MGREQRRSSHKMHLEMTRAELRGLLRLAWTGVEALLGDAHATRDRIGTQPQQAAARRGVVALERALARSRRTRISPHSQP